MRVAVGLAFAAYLAAGIAIHGDFGLSWDEGISRQLGKRTYEYVEARVAGKNVSWKGVSAGLVAEYGPFFETTLYTVERALGIEEISEAMRMRHLGTFLACWLGSLAFYALLRMRFGDPLVALGATTLYVLAPRLFGHSFFNSKDAVLAALFATGLLTMLRFVRERSAWNALAHAFVCAAAVGIRVVGVLLPLVTFGLLVFEMLGHCRGERRWGRLAAATAGYAATFAALVLLFWPATWDGPVAVLSHAFGGALASKQALATSANHSTLYLGSFVEVSALPWHYLPVWIAISVPPLTVLLFVVGTLACARSVLTRSWFAWENLQTIAFLLLFFGPVLAAIVLGAALYDDWRHMYFVFPAFAAIAATGLATVFSYSRTAGGVLVAATVVHGVWTIAQLHPYENVYFSVLAGRDVEATFEVDYWGLSYREGLEYVLASDPRGKISVAASDYPGILNRNILPPAERARLEYTEVDSADWFLTNHRQPRHYATFREKRWPCVNEAFAVRRNGATLLGVYRLR